MLKVDLNCDMGEGCANDAELMKFVSSVSIACGSHAGDLTTMRETVRLAIENNVAIGAHPSYPDRENFGRLSMPLSSTEVFQIVIDQIKTLKDICDESGATLRHVKPHGALYNDAAKDQELAAAIAAAVSKTDRDLVMFGLSGSQLISEAEAINLKTASEVFADRTYRRDGSLTPRSEPNALITETSEATEQVLRMIKEGNVVTTHGDLIAIRADTVCIHGDGNHAVEFARSVRNALDAGGVRVRPF